VYLRAAAACGEPRCSSCTVPPSRTRRESAYTRLEHKLGGRAWHGLLVVALSRRSDGPARLVFAVDPDEEEDQGSRRRIRPMNVTAPLKPTARSADSR